MFTFPPLVLLQGQEILVFFLKKKKKYPRVCEKYGINDIWRGSKYIYNMYWICAKETDIKCQGLESRGERAVTGSGILLEGIIMGKE